MIIKQKYRNNNNEKVLLERDENDPYYNVVHQIRKYNKWTTKHYYKFKTKIEAEKVYQRM